MLTSLLPHRAGRLTCVLVFVVVLAFTGACTSTAEREEPGGDGDGADGGATTGVCFFMTEVQIMEARDAIQDRMEECVSQEDELDAAIEDCRETPPDASFTVGECVDCLIELIEGVYQE